MIIMLLSNYFFIGVIKNTKQFKNSLFYNNVYVYNDNC